MEIYIENYRGIKITFNPVREKFNTVISDDNTKESKSFNAVKKFIDEYRKNNQDFSPFKIETIPCSHYKYIPYSITIIGLRKDEKFVSEDIEGVKKQISTYDENSYMVVDESNVPILKEIITLNVEIDKKLKEYNEKRRVLITALNVETLKDVKLRLLS